MKAAVLYEKSGMPQYVDFPEPAIRHRDEALMFVKAVAIKHLDKSRAGGTHYSTCHDPSQARVIGGDGAGVLEDGTRVYAIGTEGMMAEKAVINKNRMVCVPAGLDDITAAALPNAVIGSAMGLRYRAALKPGETVLINGATGFTGKLAVQVAKQYGAGRVIATGRNAQTLQSLALLGADETVSVQQDDQAFIAQIKEIHGKTPVDVIIDYLWGHTAEMLFAALKGRGSYTHRTRFVSIGAVTGDLIRLSAENLRSVDLQLSGSGLGSWTQDEIQSLFREILPDMFQLAAGHQLEVDTLRVNLKDIAQLWSMDVPDGRRLVVAI